ncbi:MAG TPA: glycosyltransferase family 39 protein [Bryobacteraceae bacterium]|nr:glycosyltransferase family 39 protein [Bryobacteraceae bacterium]
MDADRLARNVVLYLAACKLLLHLYANQHYGYFIDELYYLACSRHLDWGYVDQPPLIAGITWLTRSVLGESLAAIRFLPAVAGAGVVALAGMIAREMGGKWFAQGLAALAVLIAPGFLSLDNLLTMNAFEPLFWMGCAWLVLRIIKTRDQRLWIWFGVLAGVGLENKYSMGLFGAGLVLGVLLSPQRSALARPWIWVGGAIAFLLFLPNLLWNVQHHFPFLELQANIRRVGRDVPLGPLAFLGQEALTMHPLNVPIWLAGLVFYFSKAGKPFRALGWAWVFTAVVIMALSPRIYYLYPAFPVLFAAGGVAWEGWLSKPSLARWKFAGPVLMATTGAVLAPLAIPVLSPETYIRYTQALHLAPPPIETHRLGPLPQIFADQFGWPEMAATVAYVYNRLPPGLREKTAIFAQNYGQAGAIDLFGPRYGLPPAISGHQNYFLWGPRGYSGESMIVMDDSQRQLESLFASVQKVGRVHHPFSMPYEHFDVFYCRGPKQPLSAMWPRVKRWD